MNDSVCEVRVHQGLNIRRIRSTFQIKQEALAQKLGIAQQTMSKYENQEVVDEDVLEKCAKALDVPVNILKNMPSTQDAPMHIFKDVSFVNSASSSYGSYFTFNYGEKIMLKALQNEVNRLKEENEKLKSGKNEK